MTSLRKPCIECGRLSRTSYCPEHTVRPYNNAQWQNVRRAAIKDQPWCTFCGHEGSPDNPLTGDHIIPLSKGGTSTPDNVRVLCRSCNSRRGAGNR